MKTTLLCAIAAIAIAITSPSAAQGPPPRLELKLAPHPAATPDEGYIAVEMRMEAPRLAKGEGLVRLPLTLVGIPSARYDGEALQARDDAGPRGGNRGGKGGRGRRDEHDDRVDDRRDSGRGEKRGRDKGGPKSAEDLDAEMDRYHGGPENESPNKKAKPEKKAKKGPVTQEDLDAEMDAYNKAAATGAVAAEA